MRFVLHLNGVYRCHGNRKPRLNTICPAKRDFAPDVAKRVDAIAKRRRLSDNRVLTELIEEGIKAREERQEVFFSRAEKFRAASDPEDVKSLGDELGRFVFGE